MQMVTLRDIARAAGVSTMTVSNVVNNNLSKVSEENATRIRALIKEMGYVPNSSARSLAKRSSKIIALILRGRPDENALENPHNAILVGTMIQMIQQRGYYAMLSIMNSKDEISKSLQTWNAEGAIFLGMFDNEIETLYRSSDIPMIFVDSYSSLRQLSNVGINDYKGGYLAAKHFIEHGHHNLAFVGPQVLSNGVVQHRFSGFCDALSEYDLSLPKENIFAIKSATEQSSIAKIGEAIALYRKDITGIFVTSDEIAAFLIQSLRNAGAKVPADFSVIGFDDLVVCQQMHPQLTTISQDLEQKGKLAIEILFHKLADPLAPAESLILDVELVERESVITLESEL